MGRKSQSVVVRDSGTQMSGEGKPATIRTKSLLSWQKVSSGKRGERERVQTKNRTKKKKKKRDHRKIDTGKVGSTGHQTRFPSMSP